MFESVRLFLLVDLSFQLTVNSSCFIFLLSLELVLNHAAQMMQEADCAHCRRPMLVALDAVQKLLGILISMLSGGRQMRTCPSRI